MSATQSRYLPVGIFLATCFGVFILPFFFPPPILEGLSASNVAGFNNKVASVVTAALSVLVLVLSLRSDSFAAEPSAGDYRPLCSRFILLTTLVAVGFVACFSALIAYSQFRYTNDAYYFINQISMHADYGRVLYDQIEFPYGPLLFYSPILLRGMLSPFHVSTAGAYFTTLILVHLTGMLTVGWLLNGLPMLYRWRKLFYLLCAVHTVQPCFGLNYTYFRFITPAAFLLLASRQQRQWALAATLFIGQIICLGISPEMGFGFLVSGTAYAAWYVYTEGSSRLFAAAAPLVATPVFLLYAGGGYIRMLGLFAKGVFNFVVEPLPHILLFLYALIWLIPPILAMYFQRRRKEAPLMGALYILCLALLPVAFGRADPGHVFLNEIPLFMLSLVAICWHTPGRQTVWAVCLTLVLLWSAFINVRNFRGEFQTVIRHWLFQPSAGLPGEAAKAVLRKLSPSALERQLRSEREFNPPLDMDALRKLVGNDPVATPTEIPLPAEDALRKAGQYVPAFYCFQVAVLDRSAELRQVQELNASRWLLVPKGSEMTMTVTPSESASALGLNIPYPEKRPPYVVGRIFDENLKTNWQAYGQVGVYEVYKRR